MSKLAILELGNGGFAQGFPVSLEIREQDQHLIARTTGNLPAAPEVIQNYQNWQQAYQALDIRPRGNFLEIPAAQITNVSIAELAERCQNWFQALQTSLVKWYSSEAFSPIREKLLEQLRPDEAIRIVVCTADMQLWQIPWSLFFSQFLTNYHRAEIALSASVFERVDRMTQPVDKVRILAILGNSDRINIEPDCQSLQELVGEQAEIVFLANPKRQEIDDKLWGQRWDIFFFAGHSCSQGDRGQIYINQTESITIEDLKYGLKTAIRHGLQLAIFNSCDDLGLAKALTHLHIPQTIVMREAVPDMIAQKFLHYFLEALVEGTPFYISVRTARERLHALDRDFPYASWMPAIAQNPAETPLTWKSLLSQPSTKHQKLESRNKFGTVLIASAAIALLTMAARYFGFLQVWELSTLDAFMQLRPVEPQDGRLLVVTIDEKDVKYQQREGMILAEGSPSLSPQALAKLLAKLDHATSIGLDIYHNPKSIQPDFANLLQQNQKLFTVCKVSESDGTHTDSPPRGIPVERQGFSDVVVDANDTIRRQLLRMEDIYPTSKCTTEYALSMQLAAHYLWRTKGITVNLSPEGYLQLGDATLPRWRNHMGGYQKLDDQGYQILLNYRSIFNQEPIAQTISLELLLSDNFQPETVKDRIVLIGVTDPTIFDDSFYTPFSGIQPAGQQKMPGVTIQAQMVSNLLSTVLEKRPQIQVWSVWVEGLWVWAWAIVGGSLVLWLFPHNLSLGISTGVTLVGTLVILSGSCFAIFIQGWWLPLVPAAIALLATSGIMLFWVDRHSKNVNNLTNTNFAA